MKIEASYKITKSFLLRVCDRDRKLMSQNFMGAEITILPLQLSGSGELQVWGAFMKPAWPYSAPL